MCCFFLCNLLFFCVMCFFLSLSVVFCVTYFFSVLRVIFVCFVLFLRIISCFFLRVMYSLKYLKLILNQKTVLYPQFTNEFA